MKRFLLLNVALLCLSDLVAMSPGQPHEEAHTSYWRKAQGKKHAWATIWSWPDEDSTVQEHRWLFLHGCSHLSKDIGYTVSWKKNIPFGFHLSYFGSAAQVRYGEKNLTKLCLCRQAMLMWVSVGSASLRSVALMLLPFCSNVHMPLGPL